MPCIAILISTSKNPVPSYYCLYSLYNKIRNKGKIVSAGYRGGGGRGRGRGGWQGRGWGQGGEMTHALYAHMNNKKIIIIHYYTGLWSPRIF
jgi:hypothetical protein